MERQAPSPTRRVSESEYLRLEELAKERHEYRRGEIVAMTGGTADHSRAAANLIRRIGERLDGSPSQVFGSDLRVRCDEFGHYNYPDATVI